MVGVRALPPGSASRQRPLTRRGVLKFLRCPPPQGERARSAPPSFSVQQGTAYRSLMLLTRCTVIAASPSPLAGEGPSAVQQQEWVRVLPQSSPHLVFAE